LSFTEDITTSLAVALDSKKNFKWSESAAIPHPEQNPGGSMVYHDSAIGSTQVDPRSKNPL